MIQQRKRTMEQSKKEKVVNAYGVELEGWKIENDVHLLKELSEAGFDIEVKETELKEWIGHINIAGLKFPLIVGYWLVKNKDDLEFIDYMIGSNFDREYEIIPKGKLS